MRHSKPLFAILFVDLVIFVEKTGEFCYCLLIEYDIFFSKFEILKFPFLLLTFDFI
jgi:hypothetical protein